MTALFFMLCFFAGLCAGVWLCRERPQPPEVWMREVGKPMPWELCQQQWERQ